MNKERKGELYVGLMVLLWSLFPVVTAISISSSGPLFSLAVTTFFIFVFSCSFHQERGLGRIAE